MNGIHDMGGMHGFGPIQIEHDEPRFHAPWEARVVGLMEVLEYERRIFNTDEFRYGIEQIDPMAYLSSSYFARWLATLEYNLQLKGVLESDEVDARFALLMQGTIAEQPATRTSTPWAGPADPESVPELPAGTPQFSIGEAVIARNVHPQHHTRLARYIRGKRGVINRVHGQRVFPDTNAHNLGTHPQCCYNVRFDARELWGDAAEPHQTVSIDLWESYLESAPT